MFRLGGFHGRLLLPRPSARGSPPEIREVGERSESTSRRSCADDGSTQICLPSLQAYKHVRIYLEVFQIEITRTDRKGTQVVMMIIIIIRVVCLMIIIRSTSNNGNSRSTSTSAPGEPPGLPRDFSAAP